MKILRITLGVILVVVGLAALVTPLTPGSWLALIGLELLGFGFLIPQRLRDVWQKSSAHAWFRRKFGTTECHPDGSRSPDRASHHD